MKVLLQREVYLIGIDGLDEIISNLGTDCLVHDVFLLTFCHHHNRSGGADFLDSRQRFQSTQSRHVFIKKNKIKRTLLTKVKGILTVRCRNDLIFFLFKEDDVSFQQFYFVIHP